MSFKLIPFKSCDFDDPFFDSLKDDYPGFDSWFKRKSDEGRFTYVWKEDGLIHGFLYIKDEPEVESVGDLPEEPRMKIGTLKVDDSIGGQRIGEGAVGLALWKWAKSDIRQIYVTVFPKHKSLIKTLEGFGFKKVTMKGEEEVYLKDRTDLDTSEPKKYFPFVKKGNSGRIIPIKPVYHDKMFIYSEIKNTNQEVDLMPVSNGISKIYLAYTGFKLDYRIHDLAFIYRISEDESNKRYKSVISSYCVITAIKTIKSNGLAMISKESFKNLVGNKTIYTDEELDDAYSQKNLHMIGLVYCGYFGSGNNVNYDTLQRIGIWKKDVHPYQIKLSSEEIEAIFKEGRINVQDVVID